MPAVTRWTGKNWTLEQGDVLRLLMDVPGGAVDAFVTDCPYSSGGATRGDRTATTRTKYVNSDSPNQALPEFLGDTRDQRSFAHWAALWYAEALRATADGGICLTFTDWRQLPATSDALQAGGWVWRGIVPWDKTEATRPQSGRPRAQCEYCLFGTKGPHKAWPGAPSLPGFFLDAFCGSASFGVAAIRTGRRAMLFELSAEIAARAAERMAAEEQGLSLRDAQAGQTSLLEGIG